MAQQGEVTFTYSAVVSRDQKPCVCVRFEQLQEDGTVRFAEGTLPEARLVKQQGFSDEELEQMEAYLVEQKSGILAGAKKMNNIKHLLS